MSEASTVSVSSTLESGVDFTPQTIAEIALASTKIIIGITGVFGNLSVCLVVIKMHSSRHKNSVNSLIVTQAVIDLIASLLLAATTFSELFPAHVPQNAIFANLYCALWYSRACMWMSFVISTYNLVAISMERYIAVVYPLWYKNNFSKKTAIIFVTVSWCIGPIIELILAFTQYSLRDNKCAFLFPTATKKAVTGVALFLWNFLIPCIIMGLCFASIAAKIRKQSKLVGESETSSTDTQNPAAPNPNSTTAERQPARNRGRNVTKTLAMVFLVYVICWAPDQFMFLQFNLGGHLDFGGVLYNFMIILANMNSACNPFIYTFQYKQYKECLKSLLRIC